MNDTMNSEGCFQSWLVFGVLPKFRATRTRILAQKDGMNFLQLSSQELETIIEKQLVQTAI